MTVMGIDLRASPKRLSTVTAIDRQSSLVSLDRLGDDDEIVQIAQAQQPAVIAIGAPLSLPLGLCCLETTCSCDFAVPSRKGRLLELELSRMGISCFFTNKASIIRTLIYRGIEVSRRLRQHGFEVIETYPLATKLILFGDKVPPKNSAASLAFIKDALLPLVNGISDYVEGLDRNGYDSILNAYTGHLHSLGATELLGSAEEGTLVLPRLSISDDHLQLMRFLPESGPITNINLRRQLRWDSEHYTKITNELIDLGILIIDGSRSGSVCLASAIRNADLLEDALAEDLATRIDTQYKSERELYPKIKRVLETRWKQDEGLQNLLVEITASQGARATGGKWSRPDITVVAVQVYDLLPGKYLDVITFEIKPEGSWDVAAVFEAASHSKAATRSFLAIHVPRDATSIVDALELLIDECERFGVGLMTFQDPADFESYATHVEAVRRIPSPHLLNRFLTTQLSEDARRQIALWIR